ncbi:MAG: DUF1772 domain-containing protein [Alphaproteobacteria bacterium]|nr:DUF1772 domain-containing protein [Alphaproteobacteria bacterium]
MTHQLMGFLASSAVVASGLVAGVFLAFSDLVMNSLAKATRPGGIEAMQVINRQVYRSVFLVLLMGMAPFSALLTALAYVHAPGPAVAWLAIGSGLYGLGVVVITVLCNVPMNLRLDSMDPNAVASEGYWRKYVSRWTRWNHVRVCAAAGATVCFLAGCLALVQG